MSDVNVLKSLSDEGQKLIRERQALEKEQEELGKAFKELEKKEAQFAITLGDVGLSSLKFQDGSELQIKEEYHCSINKNIADKAVVAEWLMEHGGEDFVTNLLEVSEEDKAVLDEAGIKYATVSDMNTTRVKSWLVAKLGLKAGTMQELELEDLPQGLHFHIDTKIKYTRG